MQTSVVFILLPLIFCFFFAQSSAKETVSILQAKLSKAETYLDVAPERSFKILANVGDVSVLTEAQQMRWHLAVISAARSQRNYEQMEASISSALALKDPKVVLPHFVDLAQSAGILLRNIGDTYNAKLSYKCALQHTLDSATRISLLANYSIALIHEGNLLDSYRLALKAKELAEKSENRKQLAKLENTLGVVSFENRNYEEALAHFVTAYKLHQEISKRDSILIVGLNILFTSVVANQYSYYDRLHSTVSRLTNNAQSDSMNASLDWVEAAYQHFNGAKVNVKDKERLKLSYQSLASDRVKWHYWQYLAKPLAIEVSPPELKDYVRLAPKNYVWLEVIKNECKGTDLVNSDIFNL